jgi:hypothetical protein
VHPFSGRRPAFFGSSFAKSAFFQSYERTLRRSRRRFVAGKENVIVL